MHSTESSTSTVTFEHFWRWVTAHPGCILSAGTPEATLFDFDDYHWEFEDEEDGHAVVGLLRGKKLVGELVIDKAQVVHVQGQMSSDPGAEGQWMFEVMGGNKAEPFGVARFLMSHGIESSTGHQTMKH